jgi:hypothetical protein
MYGESPREDEPNLDSSEILLPHQRNDDLPFETQFPRRQSTAQHLYHQESFMDLTKRETIAIELHKYGPLFKYPGKEIVAKTHSQTTRVGEFQKNYERSCECCSEPIPSKCYEVSHKIKTKEFIKWGIDLINFALILKKYYLFITFFYLSYVLQYLICIILWGIKDVYFDIIYVEFYFRFILFDSWDSKVLDLIFNILRLWIIFLVFININTKLKSRLKKYKSKVLENYYIDESVFSIILKDLPKDITKEEIIQHFVVEYKYDAESIKEVILIPNCLDKIHELNEEITSLIVLKKKMEVLSSVEKYTVAELEEIEVLKIQGIRKLQKIMHGMSKEFYSSAILTFDHLKHKNHLFRKHFYIKLFFCCTFKKPHIINGKRFYIENCPQIDFIEWKHIKISFEKMFSSSCFSLPFIILLYLLTSAMCFYLLYFFSQLDHISFLGTNWIYYSPIKAFFLLIVNYAIQLGLIYLASFIPISDSYYKQVLVNYNIMQKTFLYTIMINIIMYDQKNNLTFEYEYLTLIIFLFITELKNLLLTRFSPKYIWNKIVYLFVTKIRRKNFIQFEMHEVFADNEFNIMKVYEMYRILIISTMFLIRLYPLSTVTMILNIFILYYVIKKSLYNSSLKNINYFGYFFNTIFKLEIFNMSILNVLFGLIKMLEIEQLWAIYLIYFGILELFNLFYFRFNYSLKFNRDLSYDAMKAKFKKTFKEEKYINLNMIKNELLI